MHWLPFDGFGRLFTGLAVEFLALHHFVQPPQKGIEKAIKAERNRGGRYLSKYLPPLLRSAICPVWRGGMITF